MKTWSLIILMTVLSLAAVPAFARQGSASSAAVPKYNSATESVFKGTVQEVKDRQCAVSGGMGAHVILKLGNDQTIEVHLAPSAFVKTYDLVFAVGDVLEVTGSRVKFEGVDTIFAREIKRGDDVFVFRDKKGNPVW